MIISLKKYYIYVIALIFILATVGISSFILGGDNISASNKKIVVIDAGHGGLDGGAVSDRGVSEKNINLSIALKLKDRLEKNGIKVILTRDKDVSLHSDENDTIKEKKRSDLNNRKKIADNSGADFLISIHLNSFSEKKYRGAQVFYESNHNESKNLAEYLQKSLVENVDINNTRLAKQIDSEKLLFKNLKIPGVIVECGFLSNAEEAELLNDINYQKTIAEALYTGIVEYYKKEKPKPTSAALVLLH